MAQSERRTRRKSAILLTLWKQTPSQLRTSEADMGTQSGVGTTHADKTEEGDFRRRFVDGYTR